MPWVEARTTSRSCTCTSPDFAALSCTATWICIQVEFKGAGTWTCSTVLVHHMAYTHVTVLYTTSGAADWSHAKSCGPEVAQKLGINTEWILVQTLFCPQVTKHPNYYFKCAFCGGVATSNSSVLASGQASRGKLAGHWAWGTGPTTNGMLV